MEQSSFIELLKKGDEQAFKRLVDEYNLKVINICFRFFLNQQDAEDVAQLIFIEIFQSIPRFKQESKLSTWIYRVTVSKCLDELKKRNRKKRFIAIGKRLLPDQVADWLDAKIRPDEQMEDKEGWNSLMKALDKLPENQRIALNLSKIEGYSIQEIADIMNTSVPSVDALIFRGKQHLKKKSNK